MRVIALMSGSLSIILAYVSTFKFSFLEFNNRLKFIQQLLAILNFVHHNSQHKNHKVFMIDVIHHIWKQVHDKSFSEETIKRKWPLVDPWPGPGQFMLLIFSPVLGMYILPSGSSAGAISKDTALREQSAFGTFWTVCVSEPS